MCGIFLAIERSGHVNVAQLDRALSTLAHRGPDGSGKTLIGFARSPAAVAAGHRRLSIQDLSDNSAQPFRRQNKLLIYNGELYNFKQIRQRLEGDFTSAGDTEILFELLVQWGTAGLSEARGFWSFCMVDEQRGIVQAGRDPLGKKPLFYYVDDQRACFASEVKAIAAYLGRKPRLRPQVLDEYLTHGWALAGTGTSSPFADISQVPAGAIMSFDIARWYIEVAHRSGAFLSDTDDDVSGEDALAQQIDGAIRDRLISDRKIGLLLSGGVDSSLILTSLRKSGHHRNVKCFTGDAGKSEDADYAVRVARDLEVDLTLVPLNYDAASLGLFLDICRAQEKPFPLIGNVLGLPAVYERIATEGVPVVLDGTGADEAFAGYWKRYFRIALSEAWHARDLDWIEDVIKANADDPSISEIAHTTIHALRAGKWPSQTPRDAGTASHNAMLTNFADVAPADVSNSDPLKSERFATLGSALHADITRGLLPEWLWQNDRSAMRSGIENRSPFLDDRLLKYCHGGYRRKFRGRWNKHELRQAHDRLMPTQAQWRREKQGFRWAFARFLRANKRAVLELVANSALVRERVDSKRLIDGVNHDEELLFSELMQRCTCLAGLEESTGLTA